MFKQIATFLSIVFFLCSVKTVSAEKLNISDNNIKYINIYTESPYPVLKNPQRHKLNLILNTNVDKSNVVDYLNSLILRDTPYNGEGGNGTVYHIDIHREDDRVEQYVQYAYDLYIGDANSKISYYIENNDFEEFVANLYKNNSSPSQWAELSIRKALEQAIVPEPIKDNYNQFLTREQFCELTVNMLNAARVINEEDEDAFVDAFQDTTSLSVGLLHQKGLVFGRGDGKFYPNDYISFEEMISILGRIIDNYGISLEQNVYESSCIETSPWAREYIIKTSSLYINHPNQNFDDWNLTECAISMVMELFYNMS